MAAIANDIPQLSTFIRSLRVPCGWKEGASSILAERGRLAHPRGMATVQETEERQHAGNCGNHEL